MNYQKELDNLLDQIKDSAEPLKLLIHSCCAPCSSYVLEYLSEYFEIAVFYYNPNIYPEEEFTRRAAEQRSLIKAMPLKNSVIFIEGEYDPDEFYKSVKGFEAEPEGGERCTLCYEMRLREAAAMARKGNYDYFTTTLSISPYKNAEKLNEIGNQLAKEYKVAYLPSDFKKKNGYKRSIELSKQYNLYRQDYCGCVYSRRDREMYDRTKSMEMLI